MEVKTRKRLLSLSMRSLSLRHFKYLISGIAESTTAQLNSSRRKTTTGDDLFMKNSASPSNSGTTSRGNTNSLNLFCILLGASLRPAVEFGQK